MFVRNIFFVFVVSVVLLLTNNMCSGKEETGASILLKKSPRQLAHCETYTMTIEAKFDDPVVKKETRKVDASWSLSRETSLWNKTEKKYEPQEVGSGYDVCLKPDGVQTGTWEPVWTVYKYRRTVAVPPIHHVGDGKNVYVVYAHFARGSYFKTPGRWQTEYTAGLSVPNKNDPQIVYTASAKDSFSTTISKPKLYIYAVEGLGGALPHIDHLNQNTISGMQGRQGYQWKYKHLYKESDLPAPLFGNIANDIYMDSLCGCNKIALLGYSNGGHEVIKIAETLGAGFNPTLIDIPSHLGKIYPSRTIPIDLMITIDPVKQGVLPNGGYGFTKPGNVTSGLNFFQQVDTGSLLGIISIFGDSVDGSSNTQYDQTSFPNLQRAHIDITTLNDVHTQITNALKALVPK